MQVGFVGLLKAINNFDPAAGRSLATYAQPCISGEGSSLDAPLAGQPGAAMLADLLGEEARGWSTCSTCRPSPRAGRVATARAADPADPLL